VSCRTEYPGLFLAIRCIPDRKTYPELSTNRLSYLTEGQDCTNDRTYSREAIKAEPAVILAWDGR